MKAALEHVKMLKRQKPASVTGNKIYGLICEYPETSEN